MQYFLLLPNHRVCRPPAHGILEQAIAYWKANTREFVEEYLSGEDATKELLDLRAEKAQLFLDFAHEVRPVDNDGRVSSR